MANRTVKDAHSIKGTNPQYLIEKIIRTRIYECRYWKEECFALSAELLVDKAMELRYIGGIFGGNVKPTPFLCLILKMLQIQPEKDIIIEFIKNVDYKYVRALGAIYMRLTGTSLDCYQYLEPLYLDYRKLRRMNKMGKFEVIHVDEYIDELLREERCCDVIMPRIQKRQVLEETNQLDPRMSALEDDMDEEDMEEDEDVLIKKEDIKASPERRGPRDWDRPRRSPSPRYKRSRSKSPRRRSERDRDRDRHGGRDRDRDRDRHGDRDRDRRDRRRSRSRSRDRHGDRDRHRKRSRSRSRDRHGHKSSSSRHDDDRHRSHKSSKKSRRDKESRGANDDDEIAQANALRAKLGMAPLKTNRIKVNSKLS